MFIDNKGRLFGKINIIDFMVIIFVLSLAPMGYYTWKIHTQPQPQPQPKTTIEIPIKEYEELKNKIINYELNLGIVESQMDNYLKEHKRARKYFH